MKILLINHPISQTIDPSSPKSLQKEDPMPPLGLLYLAAYLEKYSNHQVKILDCQIEGLNFNQLKERVQTEQPDIVGMTAITFVMPDIMETIKAVKEINPEIKIILGGPHAHIFPTETISISGVDYLVLGEGEKIFKELLDYIYNKDNLRQIKGIVFKDNGEIINTGFCPPIDDLDSLPFPARRLVPYKKYNSSVASQSPITTMFSSRGCPYQCLFCNRPQFGKIFRARSAENVVREMEECQNMGIKEIFFYDDTFGIDRQRVLDICGEIEKKGFNIAWDIRTRVNTVDEEILRALKTAGCKRIHYGIEVGTQKILNVLKKGITLKQVENAFKMTKRAGIQTLGYFMIGSPSETKEDIMKTIRFMKKLDPDFVHITITTPYPATELYLDGLRTGVLTRDYWQEFAENPRRDFIPPVWEKELSKQELSALLKTAYRSFYLRPSYILKTLLKIKSPTDFLRKAKTAFSLFRI